ncbi:HNH endonuclease signature motif containing protein [Streptomyces sp. NPDC086519]|uniref:HNH endonuclease signature motif containing protein n=1 Tax=Streptomyces sp. NPDC086519 TaxID=3154863 RepID=UPI00343F66B6
MKQLKRSGEYERLSAPAEDFSPSAIGPAILDRIEVAEGDCWRYLGFINSSGYGVVDPSRRASQLRVHRVVWEFLVAPIPDGLELDHLCHGRDEQCPGGDQCLHRRCVNPAHLEPVSGAVNNARSKSPTSINAQKTHCIRGHAFTPENTYWRSTRNGKTQPSRQCRECKRILRKRSRSAA